MANKTFKEIQESINHESGLFSINSLVGEKFINEDGKPNWRVRFSIKIDSDQPKIIERGYLRSTNTGKVRVFKTLNAFYEEMGRILGYEVNNSIYIFPPEIPETTDDLRQMDLIT